MAAAVTGGGRGGGGCIVHAVLRKENRCRTNEALSPEAMMKPSLSCVKAYEEMFAAGYKEI